MTEMGNINISEDVIVTISNIAANEVEGVVSVYSGIVDSFLDMVTGNKFNRGVSVMLDENDRLTITIIIVAEYGKKVADVAKAVQENVKNAIETMTEKKVHEVNVHVHGVVIKSEKNKAVSE